MESGTSTGHLHPARTSQARPARPPEVQQENQGEETDEIFKQKI